MNAIVERHGPRVLALLQRQLGSRQDAEDAVQETWCAIWRALPRIRPEADPWPFIRTAAIRKAIDLIREREPAKSGFDLDPSSPAPIRDGPEVDLRALPRMERLSLSLFFWEGLSVREIADQLDVPTATVKTWMFRARERLRDQLAPPKNRGETS